MTMRSGLSPRRARWASPTVQRAVSVLVGLIVPAAVVVACHTQSQLLIGTAEQSPTRRFLPHPAEPGQNISFVKVNTVGYDRRWAKAAILNAEPVDVRLWRLLGAADARSVSPAWAASWQHIEDRGLDPASGDRVWIIDFSDFRPAEPGRFVLSVGLGQADVAAALYEGQGRFRVSRPFEISDSPYDETIRSMVRYFEYQRCHGTVDGSDLACGARRDGRQREQRELAREAPCHCGTRLPLCTAQPIPGPPSRQHCPDANRRVTPRGGWHHGGSFGIYMATTAPTAQSLATALLRAPHLFNLPRESELREELAWGLAWVESMQLRTARPGDVGREPPLEGGFFSSETAWGWINAYGRSAVEDHRERYFSGVGTASTAKATAALAVAARLYEHLAAQCLVAPADSTCDEWTELEQRLRRRAGLGWGFLARHPGKIAVHGYGSLHPLWDDGVRHRSEVGVRFNAAVQIWALTGDRKVLGEVKRLMDFPQTQPEGLLRGSWANLARWGLFTLADCRRKPRDTGGCTDGFGLSRSGEPQPNAAPLVEPELAHEARRRLFAAAHELDKHVIRHNSYREASSSDDYVWGHNSRLLEKAELLLRVAQLWQDTERELDRTAQLEARNPILATLREDWERQQDRQRLPGKEQRELLDLSWAQEAGRDQWHWILGRNPNAYSMVTGVGHGPSRSHHAEWDRDGHVVPGALIGGPNAAQLGALAPGLPAKALLFEHDGALWHTDSDLLASLRDQTGDEAGWWMVNEGSIYYNGCLVLVAAELHRTAGNE